MGRKTMTLQDIATKTIDTLDFPDRVIHWNLGYEHLVVATTTQVHIYNQKYINTPLAVIDGRNEVRVIELGKKYACFAYSNSTIFNSFSDFLGIS